MTTTPQTPLPPTAPMGTAFAGLWSLVWRTRLSRRHWPKLLALHLALPVIALLTVERGATDTYLQVVIHLQLMIALPLVCLLQMAAPVRDQAEAGTLPYLSVRPIRRSVFFLLLHTAHLRWLELNFLFSGLLLLAVGFWREIPGVAGLILPLLLSQAAGVLALSGLSATLGLLTRRYLVLGLLYGAIVEIGIGGIPTNINSLSVLHHVRVILSLSQPARDYFTGSEGTAGLSLLVLVLVGVLGAGIAALLYAKREFAPHPEG